MTAIPNAAASPIPSGTITFAFTDIEGSSERWDRDRGAMEAAVRRHDALLREAIAAHHGSIFKTIGDAFCAAFARPEDAVFAMLDAQRALGEEDFSAVGGLRVRAAIHTGTADERDNDYFGPTVNRVARLLNIGHGGQVLVSGVTSDIVQGSLPAAASLRDLGEHRLKDLSRPEYVYQLLGPGLIADFPPLRSLDLLPNNLPRMMTSFVGREDEVAEITALLAKHHLVTLVGSGGIGKTRTSLQVAANLLDGSGDGVWFIELAPLSNGELIPGTVAQTMGLVLAADKDPLESLVADLRTKRTLLVFDNCEHLVDAASRAIAAILRGCPNIAVLASSRQGLGIAGEVTFRMPSLTLPRLDRSAGLRAEDALQYTAIALFVERSRAADTHFTLSDETAPIVADICRRLDGIALAIELAAPRVKILSPKQLRDRLDERFRVLTGGSRDVLPRQQTLRALIDWSHDLLDERERTLFRRLGIFVDGFTLEAATAVASGEDLDEFDVFDLVASLVEKSLVLAEPNGDALRYRLLESTRAYAREKLTDAGEWDAISRKHLVHLRDRYREVHARMERTRLSTERIAAFTTEMEDIRAALDWAATSSEVRIGAELLEALDRIWDIFGLHREGIRRVAAIVERLSERESLLLAHLETITSGLADGASDRDLARDAGIRAVGHARASDDGEALAYALRWYAKAETRFQSFDAALAAIEEAESVSSASSVSPRLRASLVESRAQLSVSMGDLDAAAVAIESMRSEAQMLGNIRNACVSTMALANIENERNRPLVSIELVREILPAIRNEFDKKLLRGALSLLASALFAIEDVDGAVDAAHECLESLDPNSDPPETYSSALEVFANQLALQGDVHRSALLGAFVNEAVVRHGLRRTSIDQPLYEQRTTLLADKIAPAELAHLTSRGAALTTEAAIALALQSKTNPGVDRYDRVIVSIGSPEPVAIKRIVDDCHTNRAALQLHLANCIATFVELDEHLIPSLRDVQRPVCIR